VTIKSIDTRYAGCRFRSRLEARWAMWFNELGNPHIDLAYAAARSARFEWAGGRRR